MSGLSVRPAGGLSITRHVPEASALVTLTLDRDGWAVELKASAGVSRSRWHASPIDALREVVADDVAHRWVSELADLAAQRAVAGR